MDNKGDSGAQLMALARKHKVALGIGAGVLLLLTMADGKNPSAPSDGPVVDSSSSTSSSSSGASSSGGTPGFDMDEHRRKERRSDREQEKRIDAIRDEEECVDPETGRVYKVSIHIGCPQ